MDTDFPVQTAAQKAGLVVAADLTGCSAEAGSDAERTAAITAEARALAQHLQVALLILGAAPDANAPEIPETPDRLPELFLRCSVSGLSLEGDGLVLRGDLSTMLPRLKHNNLTHEMLVKAARLKGVEHPTALDATAGMGEDSLLLAAAGFTVTLYEYDPVIAALLRDALRRAADVPELAEIVSRMTLVEGDSIAAMQALTNAPDLILLDPMFPERTKSALVKKKFQLLHRLEQPCSNEEDMLRAAISAHPRRIVVKRPMKGPLLAGVKPSYSLTGKAIRYDCFS